MPIWVYSENMNTLIKNEKKRKISFCISVSREFADKIKTIQKATGLTKSAVVSRMLHLEK